MPHIATTHEILEEGIAPLCEQFSVHMHEPANGAPSDEDYLIDVAQSANILITTVGDPVNRRVLSACPDLRMVAQYGVGVNNIDLETAREREIVVTNTPGVLTDATADLTWALLLAVARRIRAADQYVRDGHFTRWETTTLLGMELSDRTLGIVGLGRIGEAVARRGVGFGMNVVYYNRSRANPTVERELSARYVTFEELVETSDVISLHCPLNEESYHLIDSEALQAMKETALLINTARGPVVDEAALEQALRTGEIAGAGLDVFEEEPLVHPGLFDRDRVVLSPHLGSATVRARRRMGKMCSRSVLAYLNGAEEIPHRVV